MKEKPEKVKAKSGAADKTKKAAESEDDLFLDQLLGAAEVSESKKLVSVIRTTVNANRTVKK